MEVIMRNIKVINSNWLFTKNAKSAPATLPTDWEALNLPFTWNGGMHNLHRSLNIKAQSSTKEYTPFALNPSALHLTHSDKPFVGL